MAGCDLVMVADDTCQGLVKAVETCGRAFLATEVAMVAGNHYGHVLADKLEAGRERGRRFRLPIMLATLDITRDSLQRRSMTLETADPPRTI